MVPMSASEFRCGTPNAGTASGRPAQTERSDSLRLNDELGAPSPMLPAPNPAEMG